MAVYNGARYLQVQLSSILEQLRAEDELVIIDDASSDHSTQLLYDINDRRIRLYRNKHNCGVLASFERALSLAGGDIIFLSDQDDLWLPNKVSRILSAFHLNTNVTLVTSDAIVIDEEGSIVADSFFKQRGRFSSGFIHNLVKNKHIGCTLAFRSSMLDFFLPIPKDVPMHDAWFGLINSIYGDTLYIDQPLIAYRRHANNLSPNKGTSLSQKIVWRWRLIRNIWPLVFDYLFKVRKTKKPHER